LLCGFRSNINIPLILKELLKVLNLQYKKVKDKNKISFKMDYILTLTFLINIYNNH